MKTFVLESDNNITVFATAAEAKQLAPDAVRFTSVKHFTSLSAAWPTSRLVEIWNGIPGVVPVKKFTDRKTAARRIWAAIQLLEPAPSINFKDDEATTARTKQLAPAAREGSKKDIVITLLKRTEGATLDALMSATGWQAHSVRGFISGTLVKKLNLKIDSVKKDGHRVYSVAG